MKTLTIFAFALFSPIQGQTLVPAEAIHLKEQRDWKVAEIDKALVNELSKLREKYIQIGERDKAAAVTRMIDEASPQEAITEPADRLLAKLIGKWRRDYDKAIFEFKDTKSGVYGGNTPFTFYYDSERKRVVMTAAKWVDSVSFTLNADILRGGHDNKIPYKLERIP